MSYNGFTPVWVLYIPNKEDPNYDDYLLNQASKDGMPEHVRLSLLKSHEARRKRDQNKDV